MRIALLLLTLTVCLSANAQSTIANGTLNYALLNQSSLINGLVSYWKLDEAGTGTRYDSWGKNDLTANNSPSYAAGKVGNAATFVAASSQSFQTASFAPKSKILTVSFWLKCTFNNLDGLAMELSTYAINNNGSFFFDPNSSSGMFDLFMNDQGYLVTRFTRPSSGLWHHYTFILDNSTTSGAMTAYVDNVQQSLSVIINGKTKSNNFRTDTLYIASRAGSQYFMSGDLDEVGIWSRALSTDEITALYKSGTGCTYPSFSRRSQPLDFDWDNWKPLVLPEQIPVAFVNRKPTLISLCE